MAEAIRLVIWDLDETFWRGTFCEGGIEEYIQGHHDIVIELAKRGIMSTVCSKNDPEAILPYLAGKGILDYFIFPCVSWDSKAARVAALIETIQLRPATVMFIDDNPNNLAEAKELIPEIQLESPCFLTDILSDPRFEGKDDRELSRLAHYKLLARRKSDEKKSSNKDNEDFLRSCDIRVSFEYDIEKYIDRAIELINRTTQLNYTKNRLSEDPEEARRQLRAELKEFNRQAGLVRVIDKYGDYGFVGFFLMRNQRVDPTPGLAFQTLIHYCFSCRTLGMLVEKWVYDSLKRPQLTVVGDVLANLDEPRTIDWISLHSPDSRGAVARTHVANEIRIWGGCESHPVAHYLSAHADSVRVIGNFSANGMFVHTASAPLFLSACDRAGPDFRREAETLGISYELLTSDYLECAPEGLLYVFNFGLDAANWRCFTHKKFGWKLRMDFLMLPGVQFLDRPKYQTLLDMKEKYRAYPMRARAVDVALHILDNYDLVSRTVDDSYEYTKQLFDRLPEGSKTFVLLNDERVRISEASDSESIVWKKGRTRHNEVIRSLAKSYPHVAVLSFSQFINCDNEIQLANGGNHYDRMVYQRLAEGIVERVGDVPVKKTIGKRHVTGSRRAGQPTHGIRAMAE